jgi:hypothetical protein
MAIPHKGFKILIHNDTQYRWMFQNRTGSNELVIELPESVRGQVLIAQVPKVVNHQMIRAALEFGRENGWNPEQSGPPYRCVFRKRGFERLD